MGEKVCLRCKGKTLLVVVNKLLKTKSSLTSNLFMSFCMIFSYIILGWYHHNLLMKIKQINFLLVENSFFFSVKKVNNTFIPNYRDINPKATYENIVQKDMNKFITQQCFALLHQVNFPANNLNFHWMWRWWDLKSFLLYLKFSKKPMKTFYKFLP